MFIDYHFHFSFFRYEIVFFVLLNCSFSCYNNKRFTLTLNYTFLFDVIKLIVIKFIKFVEFIKLVKLIKLIIIIIVIKLIIVNYFDFLNIL